MCINRSAAHQVIELRQSFVSAGAAVDEAIQALAEACAHFLRLDAELRHTAARACEELDLNADLAGELLNASLTAASSDGAERISIADAARRQHERIVNQIADASVVSATNAEQGGPN